jgi:membrane protein required for colicin V production
MVIGAMRGGVREIFALAAWAISVAAARLYGERVSKVLPQLFGGAETQLVVGYIVTFLVVFIIVTLMAYLLRTLLKAVGLSALDRGLGIIFGGARATIIALVIGIIGGLNQASAQSWWHDAFVAAPLETAVMAAKPWLPQAIALRIDFKRSATSGAALGEKV